jgi:hypothetical protein
MNDSNSVGETDLGTQGIVGITAQPEPKAPPPLYRASLIRRHALKVSIETRNGKFKRVSQEFIDNVMAAIETKLRSFELPISSAFGQVEPEVEFLTTEGKKKLAKYFNVWVAREIHRQANNVRVGQTL